MLSSQSFYYILKFAYGILVSFLYLIFRRILYVHKLQKFYQVPIYLSLSFL